MVHFLLLENVEVLFTECVNIAKQDDIVKLDARVGIGMDLLALPQIVSEVLNVLFHGLALVRLLSVDVNLANLVLLGLL